MPGSYSESLWVRYSDDGWKFHFYNLLLQWPIRKSSMVAGFFCDWVGAFPVGRFFFFVSGCFEYTYFNLFFFGEKKRRFLCMFDLMKIPYKGILIILQ